MLIYALLYNAEAGHPHLVGVLYACVKVHQRHLAICQAIRPLEESVVLHIIAGGAHYHWTIVNEHKVLGACDIVNPPWAILQLGVHLSNGIPPACRGLLAGNQVVGVANNLRHDRLRRNHPKPFK